MYSEGKRKIKGNKTKKTMKKMEKKIRKKNIVIKE